MPSPASARAVCCGRSGSGVGRLPAERPQKEKHGGKYYPVKINRVGRRYAFNVFGALDDGLIDRQDAAALLEVGQHLIPTYRNKLRGPTQETA